MTELTARTILAPIFGGILIGIATTIHLWLKGRITGMSGIFYGFITGEKNAFAWKLSLICGILIASTISWNIVEFEKVAGDYVFD